MTYDDTEAWRDAESMNMTIHYIFILKKGSIWSADATPEIDALQEAHLANYRRLEEIGKLIVTGPFLDAFAVSGEVRGMGVLNAATFEEAQQLIATDPMVKVGRLIYELHAWMTPKNIFQT